MLPGITIAQSRQSPPPGGNRPTATPFRSMPGGAESVLFSTAGLGTVEIHAPTG